jgi:hypothetical protein
VQLAQLEKKLGSLFRYIAVSSTTIENKLVKLTIANKGYILKLL